MNDASDWRFEEVCYGPDTSGCATHNLSDLIRKRAYQLYDARGRQPGHELDDWLEAEREIRPDLRP